MARAPPHLDVGALVEPVQRRRGSVLVAALLVTAGSFDRPANLKLDYWTISRVTYKLTPCT